MATDTAPPAEKTDAEPASARDKKPGKDKAGKKPGKKKPGKKKLLIILVVLLIVGGAAAKFLMPGEPKGPPPPPPAGPVLKLESITVNLADGHFLKLGLALEMDAEAGGHGGAEPDGSKALDLAIEEFSNKPLVELNSTEGRNKAKKHLTKEIKHAYHDAVTHVYFTEFVMQ